MINRKLKLSAPCLFILVLCYTIQAQQVFDSPMRQVLGTTGGTNTFPWGTIDYTVGEVMVTTVTSGSTTSSSVKCLTQGFQQPDNTLSGNATSSHPTCIGAKDGTITLSVINFTPPVTYMLNGVTQTSPLFINLKEGIYNYTIWDSNDTIDTKSVVLKDIDVNCDGSLVIYHGFTPNGDGDNDKWVIDGITNFETNKVFIYNRWGSLVWKTDDYNNNDEGKVWEGEKLDGQDLPDATYFYLIDASDKNGKQTIRKGWVELTR